ncbi:hypothetical protein [Actinoplanes sp. NPDC051859]|uniref:hypothetical protein n=1 Tax=Actinoplanes sp. NPDC051859 TaxID=3363909 RepID=UPI0037A7238F
MQPDSDRVDEIDIQRRVATIVVTDDDEGSLLGRPDLGLYVVVPAPGGVFVTALQRGAGLSEATDLASRAAGEPVDGADFLQGLDDAGLLLATTATPATEIDGRRITWIEGVSPEAARRLFGPTAWTGYALAAVFVLATLLGRPDLRPSFEQAWFLPDPVLCMLLFTPVALLLAALHEMWHWLAGRAIGVPAVFRVSRRGVFLVFETDLSQIVAVPRRRRYGAFLAGMAIDGVVVAVALGLRLLYREDLIALPPTVDRVLATVILAQTIALVWQCAAVFLRSDGYAVLANALRCHNLYRATWLTLKSRLWRLGAGETAELADISPHDRRVARWFAVVYAAGILVTGWLVVVISAPFLISMVLWLADNIRSLAVTTAAFWESVAVLLLLAAQWLAPPLLALRERRMRRTGELL